MSKAKELIKTLMEECLQMGAASYLHPGLESDAAIALLEYIDDLSDDSDFLAALEDAGVDNWHGYSIAREAIEN